MCPDLYADSPNGHILWVDELCMSCTNQNSCALIQVLHQYEISTHMGMHVSDCNAHRPDKESLYYSPITAEIEDIVELHSKALDQKLEVLQAMVSKATAGADNA